MSEKKDDWNVGGSNKTSENISLTSTVGGLFRPKCKINLLDKDMALKCRVQLLNVCVFIAVVVNMLIDVENWCMQSWIPSVGGYDAPSICFFFIWNWQNLLLWNFSVLSSAIHHLLPFFSWLKFHTFPPAQEYYKRDIISICSLGEIARGFPCWSFTSF